MVILQVQIHNCPPNLELYCSTRRVQKVNSKVRFNLLQDDKPLIEVILSTLLYPIKTWTHMCSNTTFKTGCSIYADSPLMTLTTLETWALIRLRIRKKMLILVLLQLGGKPEVFMGEEETWWIFTTHSPVYVGYYINTQLQMSLFTYHTLTKTGVI